MDSLTFISQVIDSLAWPVAFLIALWKFKNNVSELLSRITKAKGKGKEWEIDFGERIEEVAQNAEQALPEKPATLEIRVSDTARVGTAEETDIVMPITPILHKEKMIQASQERFLKLAELHPAAAMLDSWLDLETELRTAATKHGISDSEKLPTSRIAQELRKLELWDDATFRIFSELRNLRNKVVHTRSGAITPTHALEFDMLIRRLITKLRTSN
ncbi:MAG: hypothetical protein AABY61_03310 [Nitrospirota bacterium]